MDKETRNRLRLAVTRARQILEKEIADLLEGEFGIHRDGIVESAAAVSHLSTEDLLYREQVLANLRHIGAAELKPADAVSQLVREAAFTHLNRLAAFKMMERRKLIREAVSRGLNSNGFKIFLGRNPAEATIWNDGQQDLAYRHFLLWQAGDLSTEIGVLFSPHDPANRLFPRGRVLDEVLELINDAELAPIWDADETIGWIYQYFTPKELRDSARKESAAPRNSYELAFRNQFFTPRYVVEFLTDNTLGRLWYEMRGGDSALRERCRYLVRRPREIFLPATESEAGRQAQRWLVGEAVPEPKPDALCDAGALWRLLPPGDNFAWLAERERQIMAGDAAALPTEDLLNVLFLFSRDARHDEQSWADRAGVMAAIMAVLRERVRGDGGEQGTERPIFIPYRAKRDPREIRVLDPACGSGHFLLYSYDLLETIYDEAYDDPDLGAALRADYPDRDSYRRAVPALILANNLFGIDIDLRATQIAALALWLRAQRGYLALGLGRDDRPRITRSNIVPAEPMPGEREMLAEFIASLPDKDVGDLVAKVFAHMKLAGDAGSLLRIDELTSNAIRLALPPSGPLLRPLEEVEWARLERDLLGALESYAARAADDQSYQRGLFVDDARQGFGFLDMARRRFDVVLMNPPFGAAVPNAKPYIEGAYPRSKNDLYAAFVERGLGWLRDRGLLGAITSRTGFFLTSFQRWREEVLLKEARPTVFADLGYGVLDTAAVETAAYCLEVVR